MDAHKLEARTWDLSHPRGPIATATAPIDELRRSRPRVRMQYSTSLAGLPSWGEESVRRLFRAYAPEAFAGYDEAIHGLDTAPSLIEEERRLRQEQYTRGIGDATRRAIASAFQQAFGRGTVGSSMMGETAGGIAGQLGTAARQAHGDTNIWASQAMMKNLLDRITAHAGRAGMMGDLLGLTRYSTSETPIYPPGLGFSPT